MTFETKKKLRNSGIIFSIILNILFVLIPYVFHKELNEFIIFLSIIILIISIVSPYSLRKPLNLWIKLGNFLSKINSYLILGIFFYVIIMPAAFLRKLLKIFIKNKQLNGASYYKYEKLDNDYNFKDQF